LVFLFGTGGTDIVTRAAILFVFLGIFAEIEFGAAILALELFLRFFHDSPRYFYARSLTQALCQ
jgi:hypothetical protein